MITAENLTAKVSALFGGWTQATARPDGRVALLTPAEYPDREGVVVYIERDPAGGFAISDSAEAEAALAGTISGRRLRAPADKIAARHQVEFRNGRVIAPSVDEERVAEMCWRVAQASAALAEAGTYLTPDQRPERPFRELLATWLEATADVRLERNRPVRGLSGYEHHATLFVPPTETVLEPVGGRKAWSVASKVYAEFGDLGQANGYQLIAVLDDREMPLDHEAKLLGQVGKVARWSAHEDWLSIVTRR